MAATTAPAPLTVGTQFDVQRQKAAQQEAAALQTQKDALARRAAALGGGPSGAFIKQENVATDASARRLADANAGIGAQEQQAQEHVNEINQGQAFQTSERLGSQTFAAGESALQRKLVEQGLDMQAAGLTGVYNGKPTVAAKGQADAHDIAVAGLTGNYNGAPTLAKQAYDTGNKQTDIENRVNIGTTISTLLGNWKTQGLTDDQIQQRMGAIFSGMDLKSMGIDLGALMNTYNPAQPPAPGPAPVSYNSTNPSSPNYNYGDAHDR